MAIAYNQMRDQTKQDGGVAVTESAETRLQKKIAAYVKDDNPEVQKHLEWFQDQKLGLMIHWGLYSQLGMKESWPLVDCLPQYADPHWTRWQFPEDTDPREFKLMYRGLHKSFNPVRFRPDEWADFAKDNGFRYLLFTTKHHDGFCMWDTATTDYCVTGEDCPFHDNPNADIVRKLYDAFRKRGLGISVYFSKSDWHNENYWGEAEMLAGTNGSAPTYDPAEDPERWERFVQYTHRQLRELGNQSGKVDCIWLDGGVVSARSGRDIRIGEIMDELRQSQPWLLCADRSQGGKYENFLTPELEIPESVLPVPWETCLCLGKKPEGEKYTSFGFTYDQPYFTPEETLTVFLEVICRGGNLALNIAPQPDGRFPEPAKRVLRKFGAWLNLFGDGIYGTRPLAPYFSGKERYLQKNDKKFVYHLYEKGEPAPVSLTFAAPFDVQSVTYMRDGSVRPFTRNGDQITVQLPEGMVNLTGMMADGFALQ